MKIDLDSLSEEELRALNREIIKRLDFYSFARRKIQLMEFRVGDKVEFDTDHGTITGTVTRINQKTASIDANDGRGWRVSPGFLRKVGSAQQKPSTQGNLFQFPPKIS